MTSTLSKPVHPPTCAKVTHLRLLFEPHLRLRCHLLLFLGSRKIQNHQSEIFHLSSETWYKYLQQDNGPLLAES